jgi:rare lipoprotein A (peptidoglycan hydrolase)
LTGWESFSYKSKKTNNREKAQKSNCGRMIFGVARRAGRLTGNGEPFDCVASRTAHPTARYQPTLSRVRLLKTKKSINLEN